MNYNGVNSLNFSPDTEKLVLTTGDGGNGYDPFNLSQNIMEVAGKIIEIDVASYLLLEDAPVITRFNELPVQIQRTLTVITKGVRNITSISYQKLNDEYIKNEKTIAYYDEAVKISVSRIQPLTCYYHMDALFLLILLPLKMRRRLQEGF